MHILWTGIQYDIYLKSIKTWIYEIFRIMDRLNGIHKHVMDNAWLQNVYEFKNLLTFLTGGIAAKSWWFPENCQQV